MYSDTGLVINRNISIPFREIKVSFSRSGGAGGQNVNKVNTKVSLRFDFEASSALTPLQKQLIRERLANRVSRDSILQLVASEHRTQHANREAAMLRLAHLLRYALTVPKSRKPTSPTRSSKERRLNTKHKRSQLKKQRKRMIDD